MSAQHFSVSLSPQSTCMSQVFFARENAYDHDTGWGGVGWAPNGGYYVGGECGQGFFYTLFYRKSEGLAWERVLTEWL